ncbi:MAG: hypothetical protein K0R18_151 [Bacillales bacterium]|jgi:hypothetical protein|nr:hypothetical protein [Bacillales bacterium]
MSSSYVVIGKFSEINFDEVIMKTKEGFKVDKKKLRIIAATILSAVVIGLLSDVAFAAEVHSTFAGFDQGAVAAMANVQPKPTQLEHIFEYIRWLIQLLRLIVSSVAGLICTFAGYKWSTTIDGNGAETAKKILKNAFVGGLIVFSGTTIADFFVGKMEQILN